MKLKNRIVLGSIIVTFILLIGGYWCFQKIQKEKANQKLLEEMQSHYSKFVLVEKGNLYCKKEEQYEICGAIESPITITLEEDTIDTIKKQYFKIKDTDYYIFYLDGKPTTLEQIPFPDYIMFNQNIRTKEKTNLYQDGKLVLKMNTTMDFPIYYQDAQNYYVIYWKQIFGIPKNEEIETYENMNTEQIATTQIPVLYYENINAFQTYAEWNIQLELLKEGGYHTISLSDYEKWLFGYIQVPEKTILILSNQDLNIDAYSIYNKENSTTQFTFNNKVSVHNEANAYRVKRTTSKEQYQQMLEGKTVIEYIPKYEQSVPVLNYHFFYDSNTEVCNEGICITTQKFEQQLAYLKNNGYYTLTMKEFRDWMYGEIEIPEKSVLLTIDDGAKGTGLHNGNQLIPMLEKYDMHATLFLITGWWSIQNYQSPNLDIESHTFDMHREGYCSNQTRGSQLLCSTAEQIREDLKKSIEITQSKLAFCFPLYAYNDTVIGLIKEAGFDLAFIGGGYDAKRSSNKYKIPRYPIYGNITMNQFIQIIS